jgi:serine/threonine protein kinase
MAPIVIGNPLLAPVSRLTGEIKRNLINAPRQSSWSEALVNELSSYAFSPLREGEIALYRGSGNGLAPILLVAAEETSLGCIERLEHEYELKAELDADWAARPIALTHHNGGMALVLEDPGGAPVDRLLGRPLEVAHFLRIAVSLAGALRHVHERGLIHKDIKPQISWWTQQAAGCG